MFAAGGSMRLLHSTSVTSANTVVDTRLFTYRLGLWFLSILPISVSLLSGAEV